MALRAPSAAAPVRRAYERSKQRMRLERLRLELGMELAAEEERMILDLYDLDVGSIWG
jgi:hypothetical protein